MVKKVEYNVRYLLRRAIRRQLETIQRANGYNTDPIISQDYRHPDKEEVVIWVDSGPEVFESQDISQGAQCAFQILITGIVHVEPDGDDEQVEAVLQDIRTCISSYVEDIRDDITIDESGSKIQPMLIWGQCDTDQGLLRDENEAMVVQPLIATYINGPEW